MDSPEEQRCCSLCKDTLLLSFFFISCVHDVISTNQIPSLYGGGDRNLNKPQNLDKYD